VLHLRGHPDAAAAYAEVLVEIDTAEQTITALLHDRCPAPPTGNSTATAAATRNSPDSSRSARRSQHNGVALAIDLKAVSAEVS